MRCPRLLGSITPSGIVDVDGNERIWERLIILELLTMGYNKD